MDLKAAGFCLVAYCLAALALCGDIFSPIQFVIWPRPGLWHILLLVSALLAIAIASPVVGPQLSAYLRPALFTVTWMVLTVSSVGLYADWERREAISLFHPDSEIQHSFLRSIREVPREFQFYVHSAALKGCTPYIWSYRSMSLVQLDPDVAANVLPPEWIARCNIMRTH
jgi:uncharacterized membrane protein